jgi:hypothetical protein
MAKQWVEQSSQQSSRQRDQSGMKAETPVNVRERANPCPRAQKPEALDGVDG